MGINSYGKDNAGETSPETIGRLVINDLLSRPEFMFYHVGDVHSIHYAEACAGFGALRLAGFFNDVNLVSKIIARYDIELAPAETHGKVINTANHVDANVYGILPLEIYLQTKDKRFLYQGIELADSQWLDPLPDGMTRQTRYWIDDIYMIASLQVQAFNATGEYEYLSRSSFEINAYLEKLQQSNGLFHHGKNAEFYWGRGNGWVAAGLAELLTRLPKDDKYYENIKSGYIKMMRALKDHQCDDGMWRQLVDNDKSWKETSATAMFGYAVCVGVKKGIISEKEFSCVYKNAWLALTQYMSNNGKLKDICAGTGQSTDVNYYLERPKVTGDLHGQAAILWFCYSLSADY